jgi:hypothetical protein
MRVGVVGGVREVAGATTRDHRRQLPLASRYRAMKKTYRRGATLRGKRPR